ncbi:hypothetical protein GmHk_04G010574 [Glycine max]|nr:hypothetical protein GmHk_04G010574 [Glycine max]
MYLDFDYGLGQALSRIIKNALGREVSRDADEAPQWQKPIGSTRRQREATPVAEGVQHVDHAADEIYEQLEEVAAADESPELKLSSHGRKVENFGRLVPEIEGLVVATRLSPLIACSFDTGDRGIIYAFAERWHKKTSSFHIPVREVTIILDDVASLLHLPITGTFHRFEALHVDEVVFLLVELLECWIYKHFPFVASFIVVEDYHEKKPSACCWKSGKALLVSTHIRWGPSIVIHRLEKVAQQFGYVQAIPPHPVGPSLCIEDIDGRWIRFSEYLALPMAVVAMDEPPADAPTDVDQPRHAVEACQTIAEKLERLINLRIVTKGTKTYIVTEDCLRIARGVTVQENVYVRSRRK